MFTFRRLGVLLSSFLLCHNVFAWGMTGHRIVGALAEEHLHVHAKNQVARVLDGYHLQDVSNWADEIRSERSAFSQSLRRWHYIEVDEKNGSGNPHAEQWPDNLYQALNLVVHRLKNRQFEGGLTEPVLLRLLVHLVADAHQPLHVGNGKDSGGNQCYVHWFSSKWTMSLHSAWDGKLIDAYKLSYSEYAALLNHVAPDTIARWQADPISSWLQESYQLHDVVYPQEKGIEHRSYCVKKRSELKHKKVPSLGYEYQSRVRPILNQRLTQAGIRLAGILNAIYE